MDPPISKIAEYNFSFRGVYGILAFAGAAMMAVASYSKYLQSQNVIFIVFFTLGVVVLLLILYGIYANHRWGSYVDHDGFTWWSQCHSKHLTNTILHDDIDEIHFDSRGESNQLKFFLKDGKTETISDAYIGDAKEILKALQQMSPTVKVIKY